MAESTNCPVCGATVDPESSPSSTYEGKTFHFCSTECMNTFEQEPQSYLPSES